MQNMNRGKEQLFSSTNYKITKILYKIITIPAVHIWHDEWGAHAIPFTQALWLFNLATGVQGWRTSKIIT